MRGAGAQVFQRVLQALFAIGCAEQRRQRGCEQVSRRYAAQLFQVAVGKDGMRQLERVAVFRRLVQNIALRADVADQRHHHLFADGIDGRIGDLRKELLEVAEQRLRTVREAGQRHIGAHGTDRLFAPRGHRRQQDSQVFFAVAVCPLAAQQRLGVRGDHPRRLGQLIERDLLLLEPGGVGLPARQLLLDLGVADDALLDRIDQEHAAGLQAAFLANVFRRNVQHTGF